jgi:hypothetical protein
MQDVVVRQIVPQNNNEFPGELQSEKGIKCTVIVLKQIVRLSQVHGLLGASLVITKD